MKTADEETSTFKTEETQSSENHAFLLLADPQTEDDFEINRPHAETVPDVTETLKELGTKDVFVVSCGDIMYDNLSLYTRYEDAVLAMGVPFFSSCRQSRP